MPVRYPLSKYLFRVEVDGLTQAGFRSVSGLSWEHEVVEYQEGGRNAAMVRLPGQHRLGAVTLTRGFIEGAEFAAWAREARENRGSSRRSIDIVALRDDHTEASRFTLLRAWPRKFETQALTTASEGLVETLELAHEGIISAHSREPQPSQGQAWAQGDTRARLDAAGQRARDGRQGEQRRGVVGDAAEQRVQPGGGGAQRGVGAQLGKHRARFHRGQLVLVAQQHDAVVQRHGLQQAGGQGQVQHRRFVQHQQAAWLHRTQHTL
jgi:phage tail-like protein